MYTLRPTGRGSGALQDAILPSKVSSSGRKGPGAEVDPTCRNGEFDTTHAPCNAGPPGMGAKFTAIWNSGTGTAALVFFVGGLSNFLMFGRQVFVARPRF